MKNKHNNKVAVHPPIHRNPTRNELHKLLRYTFRTDMVMCRAIILALHAGMRVAELLKLRFRDIDLALMVITAPSSNRGAARTIPITAVFADWLALFSVGAPDDLVVPLPPAEFLRRLAKLKKAAGISSWGKDVFRRGYATSQLWSAPTAAQQAMLGHSGN